MGEGCKMRTSQQIAGVDIIELPTEWPVAPIHPEIERSKPLIQYVDNLKKCMLYPVSVARSGHGEAIDNLPELINETLQKIDKRANRVKTKLENGRKKWI